MTNPEKDLSPTKGKASSETEGDLSDRSASDALGSSAQLVDLKKDSENFLSGGDASIGVTFDNREGDGDMDMIDMGGLGLGLGSGPVNENKEIKDL
jgi:hypothetical protein